LEHLAEKTRILITSDFSNLYEFDHIYIMHEGCIVRRGTYTELRNSKVLQRLQDIFNKENNSIIKLKDGLPLDVAFHEPVIEGPLDTSSEFHSITREEIGFSDEIKEDLANSEMSFELQPLNLSQRHLISEGEELSSEDQNLQGTNNSNMKNLLSLGGSFNVIKIFFCIFLAIILTYGSLYWIELWSNTITKENGVVNRDDENYFLAKVLLSAIAISGFLLFYALIICSKGICTDIARVQYKMLRAILRTEIQKTDSLGQYLNIFLINLNKMDAFFLKDMRKLIWKGLILVVNMIFIIYFGSWWALIAIAILILITCAVLGYFKPIYADIVDYKKRNQQSLITRVGDLLTGLTCVRGMRLQDKIITEFNKNIELSTKDFILNSGAQMWLTIRLSISCLPIIFAGIFPYISHGSQVGLSGSACGLLLLLLLHLDKNLMNFIFEFIKVEVKSDDILEFHNVTILSYENNYKTKNLAILQRLENWPRQGYISFKNFSLKYAPNKPFILKDVNLHINPSEKIAIVGKSNSGKTSLLLSIMRFLEPALGKIEIDEISISEVGFDDLRHKILYIPSRPILIDGSIKDNRSRRKMF